jgi:filamentous hemagglutinin family protein
MAARPHARTISADRSRRARLLSGSALYCAGLGGAAALMLAATAQAQTLPGIPIAADITVPTGGTLPTITAPDANSLDVDLKSTHTVINWASFHVSGADKVTFHFGATSDIVLNKSPTQVKVDAGGQVIGLVGADPGGNIWFYSPQGVVISPGAVMTAGNFVFARGDDIVDMTFVGSDAPLSVLRSASDSLIKIDTISSATSASINAQGELVLSASAGDLVATTVLAAKGATVSTDAGAIDIGEVTAGEAASVTAVGGDITLGALNGGTGATATGDAAVSVTSASATGNNADITITGATTASLGSATADRDIKVSAPSASLGSGTAGRDVFVTATTGAASVTGTVTAGDDIEVTATTGSVTAGTGSLTSTGDGANGGDAHVLAQSTGGDVTVGTAVTQGTGGGGSGDVTIDAAGAASLNAGTSTQDIKITGTTTTLGSASATRDVIVTAGGTAGVTGTVSAGDDIEITANGGSVNASGASLTSTGADADSDAHVTVRSLSGAANVGSATTLGTGGAGGDVRVEATTTATLSDGGSTRDIFVLGPSAVLGSASATRSVFVTGTTGNASVTGTVSAGDDIEVTTTAGSVNASGATLTATGDGTNDDAHILAKSTSGAVNVGSATTQGTGARRGDVILESPTSATLGSGGSSRDIKVSGQTATLGSADAGGDVFVTATTGNASVTGSVTAGDDIEVTATSGSVTASGGSLTSTGVGASDDAHVLAKSTSGFVNVGSAATQGTGNALGDVTIDGATTATLGSGAASRDVNVLGPTATLGGGSAGRHVFVTATTGNASVTGSVTAGNDIEITSNSGDVTADSGSLTSTGVGAGDDAHVLARSTTGAVTVGSATTQGTGAALGDVMIESTTTAALGSGASSRDIKVTAPTASLGSGSAARDVLVTATSGTASVTGAVMAGDDIEVTATTGSVAAGGGSLTSTGVGASDDAHVLVRSTSGAVTVGSATTQGTGAALGDVSVDGATTATVTGTLRSTQDVVVQATNNVQAAASTMIASRDVSVRSANTNVTVGTIRAGDDIALRALSGAITGAGDLRAGTTQGTGDPSGAADTLAGATLTGHDVDLKAQQITVTGDVAAGRTADAGETLDSVQLDSDVIVTVTAADPGAGVAALRLSTGNNSAVTAHRDIVLKSEGAVAATLQTGDVFAGRDLAVHAPNGNISMRSAKAGDDVVLRAPGGMVEVIGDVQAGRDLAGQPTTDAAGAGDDLNTALPFMDFDGNPGTIFKVAGFDVSIVGQAVRITGTTVAGRQPSTDDPETAGPTDGSTSDVRIETRLSLAPVVGLAPNIELGGVIATRDIQIDSAKAVIAGDLKAGRDIAVLGRGGVTPGAAPNDHSGSGVTIASARAGDDALAFSVYGRTNIVGGVTAGSPFPRLPVNTDRVTDGATEAADQLAIYLRYFDLDEESAPLVLQGGVIRLAGEGVTVGGNLAAQGVGGNIRVRSSLDINVMGSTMTSGSALFTTDTGVGGALKVGAITAGGDVVLDSGAGVEAIGTIASTGSDVAVRSRNGGQIKLAGISAGDDIVLRTTGAVIVNGTVSTGGAADSAGAGDALRASDGAITVEGVTFDLTGRDIDITGASVTTTGTMSAGGGNSDVRIQSAGVLNLGALSAGRDVLVDGATTVSTGALNAGRDVGVRSTGAGSTVTVGGATAGDDVVIRGNGAINITGLLSNGAGSDSAAADQAGDLMFGVAKSNLGGDFDLTGRNVDVRSTGGSINATGAINAASDARLQTQAGTGGSVKVAAVTAGRDVLLDGAAVEATGTLTSNSGDVAVRGRDGGEVKLAGVAAGDDLIVRTTGAVTIGGPVTTGGGTDGLGLGDTLRGLEGGITLEGVTFDLTGNDIEIVAGSVASTGLLTAGGGASDLRIRASGAIDLGDAMAGRDVLVDGGSTVSTGFLTAARDVAVRSTGDGATVTVGGASAGDDVVIRAKGGIAVAGDLTAGTGADSADADQAGDLIFAAAKTNLGADLDLAGRNIDVRSSAGSIEIAGVANAAMDVRVQTEGLAGGSVKVGEITAGRDILLDGGGADGVEATGTLTAGGDVAARARSGKAIRLAGVSAGDDIVLRTTGAATLSGAVSTGGGADTAGLGDTLQTLEGAIVLEGQSFDLTGADIDIVAGSLNTTGLLSATGAGSDARVRTTGAISLANVTADRDVFIDGAGVVSTGALTAGRDVGVRSTGDGAMVTVASATAGDDVVFRAKGAIRVTGTLSAGATDSADADQAADLIFGADRTRLAGDFDLVGGNVDLRSTAGSIQVGGAVIAATDARFQTAGTTGGGVKVGNVTAGRDILLDGGGAAGANGAESTGTLMATAGDVAVRARDGSNIRLKAVTAGDDVAFRSTGNVMTESTVATMGGASSMGVADRLTDAAEAGKLSVGGISFDLASSDIDVVGGTVNIFRSSARGSARVKAGNVAMNGGAQVGIDILIDSDMSLTVGDLMAAGDIALRSRSGSLTVGSLVAGDDIVLRGATGVTALSLKANGLERIGVGDQMHLSDPTMLGGEFTLMGGAIDVKAFSGPISIGSADSVGDIRLQAMTGDVTLSGLITAGRDILADGSSVNASGSLTAAGDVALYGRAGLVNVGSVSAGDDLVIRAMGDVTATGELKTGQGADTDGVADRLIAATGPTSIFGAETSAVGGVIDISGANIRLGGVINAAGESAHLRLKSSGTTSLGDATLTGDIAIDSVGDVTAGALTAGRDLAIRASDGAVSISAGTAGDDIVLRAARAITVTGALSIGQGGDAQGFGDVLFDLSRTNLGGDFALGGRNIDIVSASGDVTAGALTAPDDIRIQAASGRVTAADVNAGRDVLLDGGGVSAGAVQAGGDLAIRAANGALTLGSARAGDDLVVRAQGDITVTGALTSGGGSNSDGAGDRLAALDGGAADLAGANIDIRSITGGVAAQGSLTATDDVRLRAAGAVTATGRVEAGRDARLQAAGVSIGGELRAGRDALLDATGNVAITGKVVAGRDARLKADGDVAAAGEVEAGRDVMLDGGAVTAGTVRAGRDVAARGRTGALTLGSVTAGDDVVLRAAQGITVTGQVTAQGGADGDGAADELFAADRTALAGDFDLAGANVDIRGGTITVTGSATAGRDARFQTKGDAALTLGAVTAGGDILADGRAVTATGRLSAGRDVAVRARAGGVELASVTAGDDIAIRATGAVRASGALTSGTGANAQGAADRLISPSEGGAIMRLVDPMASTAAIEGFALAGGDVDIKSGDAISLGGDVGATNIRLQAAAKITLASATAADSIFTRGADFSLGGAWRARTARIEVTAASLNLGDGATGSGGVTLSGEQIGRIDAPVLQIFLGDTSGQMRGGNLSIGTLAIDTAKIRTSLELYAGGLSDIVITGAFAPGSTATNTTTLRIGAADAAGNWTPRSIRIVANNGGSIGSALTTGGRTFTDVRAFGVVELNAKGDILMGYQDFIDRLAMTQAASVPQAVKGIIAPQTTSGPRILLTAGALILRADGKVAQQDTGGLLGTTPTGLYLLGGGTPQLLLGRTSATPGLPEYIELNGALTSGQTVMVGESVSLLAGIAFDRGVSPSGYYRLNTCAILQQGSCMPSNGHPTISIPPEQLTGLTLEDRTAAAGAADPTVASATNEEVWKDTN